MLVARRVSPGPIRSVIDDPQEVRRQPFSWYVQQVTAAFAVVVISFPANIRIGNCTMQNTLWLRAWHTAWQGLC